MASTTSTTVENLNILDTSKTNDTAGVEYITLQEVLNALFSTTNGTQTVTIDNTFWSSNLRLTFKIGTSTYYTISATSLDHFVVTQTDQYWGGVGGPTVDFNATNTSQFLTGISGLGLTTSSLSSLLVTTDIDGGSGKDNIQGIANNAAITNIIQGGAGADVLQGGIGADHFVYTSVNDSPASGQLTPGGQLAQTWDTITNFSHAQGDKIDLSAFGGLAWNGNAGPAAHAVWYGSDGNGGIYLYADTDGNAQADLKIDLQNVTSLVTSDIIGINLGEPTIQSVNDDFAPILGNVASG